MRVKSFLQKYFLLFSIVIFSWGAYQNSYAKGMIFGTQNNNGNFKGEVYFIPEKTKKLPDFSKLIKVTTLSTNILNVKTQRFNGQFPGTKLKKDWFAIVYKGQYKAKSPGNYTFRLKSDDGSKLFVDNKLLIDNGGLHNTKAKRGNIQLDAGYHNIEVQYMQGRGKVCLALYVKPSGEKETKVNPTAAWDKHPLANSVIPEPEPEPEPVEQHQNTESSNSFSLSNMQTKYNGGNLISQNSLGEMCIKSMQPGGAWAQTTRPYNLLQPYSVNFDFKLTENDNHFILLYYDNFICLDIDWGKQISHFQPGKPYQLNQLPVFLTPEQWYHFKINAYPQKQSFEVYVDGKLVSTAINIMPNHNYLSGNPIFNQNKNNVFLGDIEEGTSYRGGTYNRGSGCWKNLSLNYQNNSTQNTGNGTSESGAHIYPTADTEVYAYTYRNWNNCNWGKNTTISAGFHPQGGEKRIYMRFDVNQINSCNNAKLRLFHYHTGGNNSLNLGIYRVTSPWNEGNGVYHSGQVEQNAAYGEICWTHQPQFDNQAMATFRPGNVNNYIEIDITNLVKMWKSGTPNYGLVIKSAGQLTYSTPISQYGFTSRERDDINKRPVLIINGTNNNQAPHQGNFNNNNTLSCENGDTEEGCCCFKGAHTYYFQPKYVNSFTAIFDTGRQFNCRSNVQISILNSSNNLWKVVKTVPAMSSTSNSIKNPISTFVSINSSIKGIKISDNCACCIDNSKIIFGSQVSQTSTSQTIHLFNSVPKQPSSVFKGNVFQNLRIDTISFDRTPYHINSQVSKTTSINKGQKVFISKDKNGTMPVKIDNFLLFEIRSSSGTKRFLLGNVEPVYYNGNLITHVGNRSFLIDNTMDLSQFFPKNSNFTLTVSALDYGGEAEMSKVYLQIK